MKWVDLGKPGLNSFMTENTIIKKPVHCIKKTCVMRHITIIVMFLSHLVATLQKIRSFFEWTKQKSVKKNLAIHNRYLLVQSQQLKHQKVYEICSKLTIKKPERRSWNLLVPLLLALNIFHTVFCVSIVEFEQVNADLSE